MSSTIVVYQDSAVIRVIVLYDGEVIGFFPFASHLLVCMSSTSIDPNTITATSLSSRAERSRAPTKVSKKAVLPQVFSISPSYHLYEFFKFLSKTISKNSNPGDNPALLPNSSLFSNHDVTGCGGV